MNNKLIAEFLNLDYDDKTDSVRVLGTTYFQPAQYHRSWDWLIPVVKELRNKGVRSLGISTAIVDLDIDKAYEALIESLEWYDLENNNKNK